MSGPRKGCKIYSHGHARGGRRTPEYNCYHNMVQRCCNPTYATYPRYGGRGIRICDRWLTGDGDKSGFECFFEDVGLRPSRLHSLERERNSEGYSKENVTWATSKQQALNRRSNVIVSVRGKSMPLSEAVAKFGKVAEGTARARIRRGWEPERAITSAL